MSLINVLNTPSEYFLDEDYSYEGGGAAWRSGLRRWFMKPLVNVSTPGAHLGFLLMPRHHSKQRSFDRIETHNQVYRLRYS